MTAHFPLDRLAKALRADGINCVIRDGAQGKSARRFASVGYYVGCQAIVKHHTVSSGLSPANDIAYIDGGKGDGYIISNAYTALDGTVTLIASGPTYTEGAGGPLGIIPQDRANDVCFSNEIASWGAEMSVYPQVQQDAVAAFAYHAAVIAADVWEWPDDPFAPHRCFAHHEWTSRKVDPRGVSRWSPNGGEWDMSAFRSELASMEDKMKPLDNPYRAYDSRKPDSLTAGKAHVANVTYKVPVVFGHRAHVNVTCLNATGAPGFVTIAGTPDGVGQVSILNFEQRPGLQVRSGSVPLGLPDGHAYIRSTVGCHVLVDVFAV